MNKNYLFLIKILVVGICIFCPQFLSEARRMNNMATTLNFRAKNYTISGYVRDAKTGETLPYANVQVEGTTTGTQSNQYGYYSLILAPDTYKISCSYIGYSLFSTSIELKENVKLNIELALAEQVLEEVVVSTKENNIINSHLRTSSLDIQTIKEMPALFGEPDVLRSIQLLPGVTNVSEVGSSFNVRGGNFDQNLILLDEAIVYNSSHALGAFSIFNPDVVKDVKFYKSYIPASYGGRLSSVVNVTQKDGNMKSYHVNGGIGLLASRLGVEGPIKKDKASFLVAFRRSYIDLFFGLFPKNSGTDLGGTKTFFYDGNVKLNYVLNDNNRIYVSGYFGEDVFKVDKYNQGYSNITATLRWNHVLNSRLFFNLSAIWSDYKMTNGVNSEEESWEGRLGLNHRELKMDFNYFGSNHKLDYGFNFVYSTFNPGKLILLSETSNANPMTLDPQFSAEGALYVSDAYKLTDALEIEAGLRYSTFANLGSANVYVYDTERSKNRNTIVDTIQYKRNEVTKSYWNLEPRLSLKYDITNAHYVKLTYNKTSQYVHLVSDNISPLPFNMWKPSNNYIKPLISHHFGAGYFANLKDNMYEFSLEAFYKTMDNVVDVKPGKDINLNPTLEADLVQGYGHVYGLEFMLNKTKGRFTGLISYTYSKNRWKIDGRFKDEKINSGKFYPANYDIPHKVTLAGKYKVTKRVSLTSDFVYASGRPVSYPAGQYVYFSTLIPYYEGKNEDRLPAYHRLDVGMNVYSNPQKHKKVEGFWTFSLYNVYARKNAYSITIRRKPYSKDTEAARLSIFGSIVPSISYSFKF